MDREKYHFRWDYSPLDGRPWPPAAHGPCHELNSCAVISGRVGLMGLAGRLRYPRFNVPRLPQASAASYRPGSVPAPAVPPGSTQRGRPGRPFALPPPARDAAPQRVGKPGSPKHFRGIPINTPKSNRPAKPAV